MRPRTKFRENHISVANKKLHTEQAIAAQIISDELRQALGFFFQPAHVELALFAYLEIAVDLAVFQHGAVHGLSIFLADGQKRYFIIKIDK